MEEDQDGERQSSSPVRESRLAALRREDTVLQGGYSSSSGRTSPTLLQRSNSITDRSQQQQSSSPSAATTRSRSFRGSPSGSRTDLLSLWFHSPRALSPESQRRVFSRSASGRLAFQQFTRGAATSFSKRGGRGTRLLKRSGPLFFLLLFLWFALDWWYLSRFQQPSLESVKPFQANQDRRKDRPSAVVYGRLLALAAHGLAENEFKPEPDDLWEEPAEKATTWLPCANQRYENHTLPPKPEDSTGYIMINANGGLSQQRVAICNAVAVARMLNATLVLPKFSFNNVWVDSSQFGDLYEVEYFIDYLKDDVRVVKELPFELQFLDLDAIEAVNLTFRRKRSPVSTSSTSSHFY